MLPRPLLLQPTEDQSKITKINKVESTAVSSITISTPPGFLIFLYEIIVIISQDDRAETLTVVSVLTDSVVGLVSQQRDR